MALGPDPKDPLVVWVEDPLRRALRLQEQNPQPQPPEEEEDEEDSELAEAWEKGLLRGIALVQEAYPGLSLPQYHITEELDANPYRKSKE